MIVDVELWAFRDGDVRQVEISNELYNNLSNRPAMLDSLLGAVFRAGQNEVQLQQLPSVSAGDIIVLEGCRYLIKSVGFERMSDCQYRKYTQLPRLKRIFHTLN